MPSHADTHDRDKLLRWQKDLAAAAPDAPPVYAVFLVSAADTAAHDIFRAFRGSFEERKAGFAHLVIFGQHGISTTVRALQQELGLPEDGLPTLALFVGKDTPTVILLPPGAPAGKPEAAGWLAALAKAEVVMDAGMGDGGALELNRVVKQRVADLCRAVVESMGKC